MTTPTGEHEDRLRARIHTIGAVIGRCHDENRVDLLSPGKPKRHRATVTIAVAAAALIVVVAAVVLVTRGGTEGATTTRVVDGPGGLDTLTVAQPPVSALVATERGIVVVTNADTAHGGRPSVYAPDAEGIHRWYIDTVTTDLAPGVSWVDGDTIRTVGYSCPPGSGSSVTGIDGPCGSEPLVALSFSLDTMDWAEPVEMHGDVGLSLSRASGNGRWVLAEIADEVPEDRPEPGNLARVDVVDGSMTRLEGSIGAPTMCASGESFVVGTATAAAGPDGGASARGSGPDAGVPTVGVVVGGRVVQEPVDPATRFGSAGVATANGCAAGGILLGAIDEGAGGVEPLIVAVGDDGASVTRRRPPPLAAVSEHPGGPSFAPDLTGKVLVTSEPVAGPAGPHRIAVWDGTGDSWTGLDDEIPSTWWVAVDRRGEVFGFVPPADDPFAPGTLRGPLD